MTKIGYKQSKEHIAKKVASRSWYKPSKETNEKIKKNHADFSGENHPLYGKKCLEQTKLKISLALSGKKHSEERRIKNSLAKQGDKHPSWMGGKSFEPYGIEFNNELRVLIRERDNFTCQECGFTEEQLGYKLCVHHIDYNKKNNESDNLICLCRSCHAQTNFDRSDWADYFESKLSKT